MKKYTRKKYQMAGGTFKMNAGKKFIYKMEHYSSGDGMLTSVWGPSLWHFLHTMSFNYPVKPTKMDKINYRNFILSLRNVLPCKYCRNNLKKNFKVLPLKMKDMESRDTFSKYLYNLHEVINEMLKKKSGLTYEDVRERYEHFRARCGGKKTKKINQTNKRTRKKHSGCTDPLHTLKSKGVVRIVPQNEKCESLEVDKKCLTISNN
jgi:hypothetical protein